MDKEDYDSLTEEDIGDGNISDVRPTDFNLFFPRTELRVDYTEDVKAIRLSSPNNGLVCVLRLKDELRSGFEHSKNKLILGELEEYADRYGIFEVESYKKIPKSGSIWIKDRWFHYEATLSEEQMKKMMGEIQKKIEFNREVFPGAEPIFYFEGKTLLSKSYNYQKDLVPFLKPFKNSVSVYSQSDKEEDLFPKAFLGTPRSWNYFAQIGLELVTYYKQMPKHPAVVFVMLEKVTEAAGAVSSLGSLFLDLCLAIGAVGIKLREDKLNNYDACLNCVKEITSGKLYGVHRFCKIGLFGIGEGCTFAAKLSQDIMNIAFQILVHPKFAYPLVSEEFMQELEMDDYNGLRDLGPLCKAPASLLVSGTKDSAKRDCIVYALRLARLRKSCGVLLDDYDLYTEAIKDEMFRFVAATARDITPKVEPVEFDVEFPR